MTCLLASFAFNTETSVDISPPYTTIKHLLLCYIHFPNKTIACATLYTIYTHCNTTFPLQSTKNSIT
jgi:hypothetical protein